ncbi:MAG: hypothetical protein IPG17_08765 [Sandaracinaceae bacterium]|jgi:hypothetical protein|nr:hypothetical protein [Sandaracinaceae bacterium]MBK7156516.1 hypothetical protein [Sandaracinaceae bacterium]MBK7777993.1 hypothetical protein [Sandaracinaceae bacterium]MBK8587910.1 hypothetical protein [Sandaracinaceae bacterium]MBP7683541.1 hypothetical protein [Deltaproteobacteria bacterium]
MMSSRARTFARVGAVVMILVGLGCAALGLDVALNGAEPDLPSPEQSVEGTLEDGPLTPSPAGDPFLYGEVRVADQPGPNAPHHRGNYGEPTLAVRQASGEVVRVQFNSPEAWRVDAPDRDDVREVMSLARLPLVGDVDTERRLNPPFHVRVRALRPGDAVLVEVRDGVALRTYLGERAKHEELHARRESMRWPMVALLLVLGVVSVLGGARLLRLRPEAFAPPPDGLE